MNTIKLRKCKKIFAELDKKHRTTSMLDKYGNDAGVNKYTASARQIEAELYSMKLNGEITHQEYIYIFGLICEYALTFGGFDFYRA